MKTMQFQKTEFYILNLVKYIGALICLYFVFLEAVYIISSLSPTILPKWHTQFNYEYEISQFSLFIYAVITFNFIALYYLVSKYLYYTDWTIKVIVSFLLYLTLSYGIGYLNMLANFKLFALYVILPIIGLSTYLKTSIQNYDTF